jgi:hypothetical protein
MARRLIILLSGFILLLGLAGAQGAAAAVPANVVSVNKAAAAPAAIPFGAPGGCPSGAVCFYNQGNGGDLCGIWYGNAYPDLGGCTNKAWSVFNNGSSCSGCQDVNLYWGSSFGGAWYCLPQGGYLLYLDKDHFNRGPGKSGYGEQMAHNIASAKWTAC